MDNEDDGSYGEYDGYGEYSEYGADGGGAADETSYQNYGEGHGADGDHQADPYTGYEVDYGSQYPYGYGEGAADGYAGAGIGIKGENSKKYLMALVLSMISVFLILVSVFSSWYVWEISMMNEDFGLGVELTFKEGLRSVEMEAALVEPGGGKMGESQTFGWGDSELEESYATDDTADVYGTINILMIITLLLAALAFFMFLITTGVLQSSIYPTSQHRNIAFAAAMGTCILAILSAILLAVQLPEAHEKSMYDEEMDTSLEGGPWDSFWGSTKAEDPESSTESESSWHPSMGWYTAIVGGAMSAAAMVMLYLAVAEDLAGERDEYGRTLSKRTTRGRKIPGGKKKSRGKKRSKGRRKPSGRGVPSASRDRGKPSCPTCASSVRLIPQYNQHWCDACQKYVRPQRRQARKKQCPRCGSATRHIQQYRQDWCDRCQQYVRPSTSTSGGSPRSERRIQAGTGSQRPCPVCGTRAEFVPQYSDYYCWTCQQYFNQLTNYRT